MANPIPETPPDSMPNPEPWNCAIDGHEYESQGEYDPETNCYPYLECIHCGDTCPWEGDADDYTDYEPDPRY